MASSATAELTDWSNDSTHTKSLSEGDPGRIAIWPAIQIRCSPPDMGGYRAPSGSPFMRSP